MRRLSLVLVLAAAVLGRPVAARAAMGTPAQEAGLALGAAGSNLVYTPAKFLLGVLGAFGGGLVGVLTGGDTRAAYAIMVPTASGDYFVRPSNLQGTQPLEFIGTDYGDTPSRNITGTGIGGDYEAQYSM